MILEIDDFLVSSEILTEYFCCDYQKCKGCCCVIGDSGAPLLEKEIKELKEGFLRYKVYMSESGVKCIEERGFSVVDADGDIVTPLLSSKGECAYSVTDEKGYTHCSVERGFEKHCRERKIPHKEALKQMIKKPISCWLYPIRVGVLSNGYISLVLSREHLCKEAFAKGKEERIPVYKFLKEPLTFRFGEKFYKTLESVAVEYDKKHKPHS